MIVDRRNGPRSTLGGRLSAVGAYGARFGTELAQDFVLENPLRVLQVMRAQRLAVNIHIDALRAALHAETSPEADLVFEAVLGDDVTVALKDLVRAAHVA